MCTDIMCRVVGALFEYTEATKVNEYNGTISGKLIISSRTMGRRWRRVEWIAVVGFRDVNKNERLFDMILTIIWCTVMIAMIVKSFV